MDYISLQGSESEKTDSDPRCVYRALCAEMMDRKTLLDIRRGTDKGLGIGSAEFLLKVAAMR